MVIEDTNGNIFGFYTRQNLAMAGAWVVDYDSFIFSLNNR
jgi:hypothetical protein